MLHPHLELWQLVSSSTSYIVKSQNFKLSSFEGKSMRVFKQKWYLSYQSLISSEVGHCSESAFWMRSADQGEDFHFVLHWFALQFIMRSVIKIIWKLQRVTWNCNCCCNLNTGDQVSKKGGMTGGFYDYRRSKLKLLSIIRENNKLITVKQQELTKVRAELQNILQ